MSKITASQEQSVVDRVPKQLFIVQDAIGKGVIAVVGGHARDGAGYFFEPTVLSGGP